MQPQPKVHPGAQQAMLQGTGGLHQPQARPTLGASVRGGPGIVGAPPLPAGQMRRPAPRVGAGGPGAAVLQRLMALHMLSRGGRP